MALHQEINFQPRKDSKKMGDGLQARKSSSAKAKLPEVGAKSKSLPSQDKLKEAQEKMLLKKKLNAFIDHSAVQVLTTTLSIYALFGDDIRVVAFNKHADLTFDVLTIIALVVFSVEIVISFMAKPEYRFGFFFWLDLISTVSLILDLQML